MYTTYDSLQLRLNSSLKRIVVDLMFYQRKGIRIEYVNMQQHKGPNDCGLFAIATATALCNGVDPNQLEFNQKLMRQHLQNALEMQKLSLFRLTMNWRDDLPSTLLRTCVFIVSADNNHTDCVRAPADAIKNEELPWFYNACI